MSTGVGSVQHGDFLPTIDFCPVIFKGTYDEQNWQVLSQRWDNLRAQLHGNPFSASALQDHALHKELIQSVLDSAPNFSSENAELVDDPSERRLLLAYRSCRAATRKLVLQIVEAQKIPQF